MQKVFLASLMVIIGIALILVGCGGPTPTPKSTTPPVQSSVTKPPSALATSSPPSSSVPAPSSSQTSASEKVIELKFSYHHPAQTFASKTLYTQWKEGIEKASNGRVKITTFPGETLAKEKDQYDAVTSGLCDMADITPSMTPGRFPLSEMDVLPMLFPNASIAGRVHNELLLKYAADAEWSKVKILWDLGMPSMQLFTNKQIKTMADMKGVKMRVEGQVESWTFETLGATGMLIGMGEVYSALDRNLVNGVAMTYSGALTYGFHQVTKNRTICNLFTRNFPVVMNLDSWKKLPPDIQKIFTDNSGPLVSARNGALFDTEAVRTQQVIIDYDKKAGNPDFYTLPADERAKWQQSFVGVWDKWLEDKKSKNLPGKPMLDEAVSLVKQYSSAK